MNCISGLFSKSIDHHKEDFNSNTQNVPEGLSPPHNARQRRSRKSGKSRAKFPRFPPKFSSPGKRPPSQYSNSVIWVTALKRLNRHRKEKGRNRQNRPIIIICAATGGYSATNGGSQRGGGVHGPTRGGSGGYKSNSAGGGNGAGTGNGTSGSNAGNGNRSGGNSNRKDIIDNGDDEMDNFECPDSLTQQWLADNADLAPLQVLDYINLKSDFPGNYSAVQIDPGPGGAVGEAKPPDLIGTLIDTNLGSGAYTSNLLQFAASVPSVSVETSSVESSCASINSTQASPVTSTPAFLDLGMEYLLKHCYLADFMTYFP